MSFRKKLNEKQNNEFTLKHMFKSFNITKLLIMI